MSTRWPPVVGVTGFDGGYKPAISLAIRPLESKAEEEGEIGGPEFELGACCYNDGTCDDLTEFDCRSAGGYFQGAGTSCDDDPNPCVGACCEPACVENTTPDGCAGDGGTFQGFGTTCDPDPCPLPPCNGCGFAAFDGSGRMFLTQTDTRTWFQTLMCIGTANCAAGAGSGTGTVVSSYDAECNFSETGSFDMTFDNCDGSHFTGTIPNICVPVTVSATEKHCTFHQDISNDRCTPPTGVTDQSETITLSDECDPGGFSPLP